MFWWISGTISFIAIIAVIISAIKEEFIEDDEDFFVLVIACAFCMVPVLNFLIPLFLVSSYYYDKSEKEKEAYEKMNELYTCNNCDDIPYRLGRIYEHSYALMKTTTICPGCDHNISVAGYNRHKMNIETDIVYSKKFNKKEAHKMALLIEVNKHRFEQNKYNKKYAEVQKRIRPERLKRMEEEIEKLRQEQLDTVNEDAKQ